MASHSGTQKGPATQLVPIAASRKPRILVAACGCVGAAKLGQICRSFTDWAEVKAVATRAGLFFIDRATIPSAVNLYTDKDELSSWSKLGDPILHVELRQWADILLIAPLSANTLAKIAGGLCDNLLTCIVRAWDYTKPFFVAPSMNAFLWRNPFTERHLMSLDELGIALIPPISTSHMGDHQTGAMAPLSTIESAIKVYHETRLLLAGGNAKQ
ncbi:probable phosphopantothenoylcysteine decarboxylase [Syzygium oleosum]|uniref:probable phosphopantothenoylcysteine decarboxylase n=1 Tax=Syzygium oleosum TaxID=219896 RepID=UPI0011D26222|nr:probable phosphopantothenoylcysteine decarboxylase [Syzygium oleosum]XP_056172646.1 probable phosphopantothenoylcysteine decarboxylase [Syzygium oleosum]